MINCIIIDDNPLAVEKLDGFIARTPLLKLVCTFNSALDALAFLQQHSIDLIFLDIQMEQMSGLQFMEALRNRPHIIIVSAYGEYAIQGFEYEVTDYLLKPYSFERFLKAIDKVISDGTHTLKKEYMFIKTEYRMERVDFSSILYIEGKGAYLQIVTQHAKVMSLLSFQQMANMLPRDNFMRIHKSFIVALDKIETIERNVVKIGNNRIPVGKSYQEEFYERI